eukprot:scaffold75423_cov121-Phaeocystis_antarctica.AAC.1
MDFPVNSRSDIKPEGYRVRVRVVVRLTFLWALSRVGSTNRNSTCMEQMENALTNNSGLVSIESHEIDIGSGHYVQRHMVMAMVDGIEIT